ncbi:MAG: LamG-like jellyroll fold domain-containing protein [Myxococcota bacterium]
MRFVVPALVFGLTACSDGPNAGEAPVAPSDVQALPGNGFIRVLWQDNSDDETGFVVYRETVTPEAVARSLVASVSADGTEWDDLQVEAGYTYRYAVASLGDATESALIEMTGDPVGPLEGDLTDCTVGDATADDQDADGVPDINEASGWTVTVTDGLGNQTSRKVVSSPSSGDTDGDGLCDREERQSGTDPAEADTDTDGLSDPDELRIWGSKPTDVDSDGDSQGNAALFDGNELELHNTSPTIADTDGDGFDDYVEIIEFGGVFNPLVANTPRMQLDFDDNSSITLNIAYSDGSQQEESETVGLEREVSSAQSNTRSSTREMWAETGIEASVEAEAGFPGGASVKASTTVSASAGYSHTSTNSVTRESSQASRNAYQNGLTTSQENNREIADGEITMGFTLQNVGDVSFEMSDLRVAALLQDSNDPTRFTNVTNLIYTDGFDSGSTTLGPGDVKPNLLATATVPANRALDLMANTENLFFEVADFALTDEEGRNFQFLAETTNALTGQIIVDFGNGTVIDERVATNVLRENGNIVGVRMADVMTHALGLEYRTATPDNGSPSVLIGVTEPEGSEIAVDDSTSSFWVAIGSDGIAIDDTTAFDDIVLRSGESVTLFYVTDQDGDGLFSHEEYQYGTSDERTDSDDDGLTDFEETKTGWTINANVPPYPGHTFSDPTVADIDEDGLTDAEERAAGTDPYNPDTDDDGDCDGPSTAGRCSGFADLDPIDPTIGADPTPDPTAFFPFDFHFDDTAGGDRLTFIGGCDEYDTGVFGADRNNLADSALDIDVNDECSSDSSGTNAGLESDVDYDFDDAFTMAFWVYLDNGQSEDWYLAGAEDVLSIRMEIDPGDDDYQLAYYESGNPVFVDSVSRQGQTWGHVAVVIDGNTVRIYFNGTEVASTSRAANFTTQPLLLLNAASRESEDGSFGKNGRGRFDDFAFYDEALTDDHVLDVYTQSSMLP